MAHGRRTGLRVAGLIVGGVGLVLGLAGAAVSHVFPGLVAAEHARLSALPSNDALAAGSAPAGTEVLVEGRVAAHQAVRFRTFVAYVKEEEERDATQRERRGYWKVVESVTPRLELVTSRGIVSIVNTSYGLTFAATRWRDRSKIIDTAYSGLVANEAVFVHGRIAAGGLEAMTVGSGTRASYLETRAGNADVAWWLGVGFQTVGAGLLVAGVALGLWSTRRVASSDVDDQARRHEPHGP